MSTAGSILAATTQPAGWFGPVAMVVGGLGLFLFGMNELSSGLKAATGARVRGLLNHLTRSRLAGAGAGAALTLLVQSTTATTVILIGLVEAQLLGWAETLPVLLGANIGSILAAQLIAFQVGELGLLLVGLGLIASMVKTRGPAHHVGRAVLAIGMVFYGMSLMGGGFAPLKFHPALARWVAELAHPGWAIVVGAAFTALIQSSAGTVGVTMALASQGVIGLGVAIPLIFGAGLGTCVTVWLASMGKSLASKRVAAAHTAIRVVAVLLFLWWIPAFEAVVARASAAAGMGSAPRQVANAYTLFNVSTALLFMPVAGLFAALVRLLLPDRLAAAPLVARHLDDSLLETPHLAVDGALRQVRDMGLAVHKMALRCLDLFEPQADEARGDISELDRQVDFYQDRLRDYLMRIPKDSLDPARSHELYAIFIAASELEHAGDTVSRVILRLADKMLDRGGQFTPQGWAELREYHDAVCDNLDLALQAMTRRSEALARETRSAKAVLTARADELRERHFLRMTRGEARSIQTDDLHMELLDALRQINTSAGKIGGVLLTSPRSNVSASA